MKTIIAGSRNFTDFDTLTLVCDKILKTQSNVEIVSGTANGADKLGERYAKLKGFKLTQFPADWNRFGKSAGYKRNQTMAEYADVLIAFWDGESRGTKHMIDLANSHGLSVHVHQF